MAFRPETFSVLFTSSPDRGLLFVLRNWFRIKEAVPQANLRVFYGFDNADKIGTPALQALKAECLEPVSTNTNTRPTIP